MTRYLDLAEFLWLAEQVTGIDATVLEKASRSELADSALHAPAAEFGGEEFYPDVDVSEQAMLSVAAHEVDEAWLAAWLRERVRFA